MNWFKKIFKKKPIIIPLVRNGKETGLYVECYKGDNVYKKLVMLYGEPLPKQIETIPLDENTYNK